MAVISLSLISHTNVGKTSLARTLLGQDVGEVQDGAHTTEFTDQFVLIESGDGEERDALTLWDTPGFGDSARLVKRMKGSGNPLNWLLTTVWDRFLDKPFHLSQRAIRHVQEQSDLVLYLVNSSEAPESIGYLASELELLEWTGKPVLVLLNQMGDPRPKHEEDEEIERWRVAMADHRFVKAVLPLDAFSRCWIQEFVWLRAIESALAGSPKSEAVHRLRLMWEQRRWEVFDRAMREMSDSFVRIAALTVMLPEGSSLAAGASRIKDGLRGIFSSKPGAMSQRSNTGTRSEIPLEETDPDERLDPQVAAALKQLSERTNKELRSTTRRLLDLHRLSGSAADQIDQSVAQHFDLRRKMHTGKAAVAGGVLSGAIGGLMADIMAGGLTLGTGALAGAILGSLSAAGAAGGFNHLKGRKQSSVDWNQDALMAIVKTLMLRYLAVAHYGRGRGQWKQLPIPAHWDDLVQEVLVERADKWGPILANRPSGDATQADHIFNDGVHDLLRNATVGAMTRLYPEEMRLSAT